MSALNKIEHFVVLMLENRSFDNLLGQLYPAGPGFNGLTGRESNPYTPPDGPPQTLAVWSNAQADRRTLRIPTPDPAELYVDMAQQIFGSATPGEQVPGMQGFADNYAKNGGKPRDIMHCFPPEQVPVLSLLARSFAVCDQWHASAPCQTWPNRFFLHTGTANGYPNNSPTHFPYRMNTLFNELGHAGVEWKIYFNDFPQSLTLSKLWPHVERFRFYEEFREDAKHGKLPAYTFIEPRYFPDLEFPNDQHPPHDVTFGEQLIADVYNHLRASPCWEKSLLVILYDEHGGCYDHAPPPLAVRPDDKQTGPFAFDRYGMRVPAVLVSPYIQPGTILRNAPDGLPHQGPPYPYDHTSVIATLRKRYGITRPLTRRDEVAPTLDAVLNLDNPTNHGPDSIPIPVCEVLEEELAAARAAPLTDFQKAAHEAMAVLPALGRMPVLGQEMQELESLVRALLGRLVGRVAPGKAQEAAQAIQAGLRRFLP
ncbi:alkaline phosphatase family protein [Methylogaea oryzae]|uniref:Phosphoesterase n=1 Tax=Methylogaea oryzae TaxID=1295382 RepID=A0A8D5AHU7_9GAMM|nr:alkaline phosphatase family protein [Methylogaea oryzae]BBL70646.1 phosphoesterase [Methylogaea oryzae]